MHKNELQQVRVIQPYHLNVMWCDTPQSSRPHYYTNMAIMVTLQHLLFLIANKNIVRNYPIMIMLFIFTLLVLHSNDFRRFQLTPSNHRVTMRLDFSLRFIRMIPRWWSSNLSLRNKKMEAHLGLHQEIQITLHPMSSSHC